MKAICSLESCGSQFSACILYTPSHVHVHVHVYAPAHDYMYMYNMYMYSIYIYMYMYNICTCTVYTCTCTCTCTRIFLSLFPFPRSITCQLQHAVPSSLPLSLSLSLFLPPVNLHIPIGSTPWKEMFPVILCGVSGSLCRNERLCQSFTREYINMCTSTCTCMYSVHVHD